MREALFIFAVLVVLFSLTLFRYRRQILSVLEFTRAIKRVSTPPSAGTLGKQASDRDTALVNCSSCGVWTPQARARKIRDKFYCSDACLASRV